MISYHILTALYYMAQSIGGEEGRGRGREGRTHLSIGGTGPDEYGVVPVLLNRKEEKGSVDVTERLLDFAASDPCLGVFTASPDPDPGPTDPDTEPDTDPVPAAELWAFFSPSTPSSVNSGIRPYFFSIALCRASSSPLTSWYFWYEGRMT